MKYINCFILLFLLCGCGGTAGRHDSPFLPFGQEKALMAGKVFFGEIMAPDFLMLKRHSLWVVSSRSDTLIYRYALPDLNLSGCGGRRGQGSDEFTAFPMFCRSASDSLYVWGYTPFTIRCFDVSLPDSVRWSRDWELSAYESFNQMHILGDTALVYSDIPGDFALKKLDLRSGEELGRITFETETHPETYYYANRGLLAAGDSCLVYAYLFKKQIDLYDAKTLQLRKRLRDADAVPQIRVGDAENTLTCYVNVVAGRKAFYALCQDGQGGYALEVFDYEGKSLARYTFDGPAPLLFDVDEDAGVLYGYNPDTDDCFLKYNLND